MSDSPVNPAVPELVVPSDMETWKRQREVIRGTLARLLGDLPARPRVADHGVRVTGR